MLKIGLLGWNLSYFVLLLQVEGRDRAETLPKTLKMEFPLVKFHYRI